MGYYDPHPTLDRLEELGRVVDGGFMGGDVQRVGHALAARTGLPIHDIDRLIEQRAGMSRAQLVLERGTPARRAHEARLIESALRATPPGIIALGDGALLDADSRARVVDGTHLVYIERPLSVHLEAIRRERERSPAAIPEFIVAPPCSTDDLVDFFEERRPGYAEAHTCVHAGAIHGARIVEAILDELRLVHRGAQPVGQPRAALRV